MANTINSYVSIEFGQKKKHIDVSKLMPTKWDLPEALFNFNLPKSHNPTINLCDAIVRKATILRENFRGYREPAYVEHNTTRDFNPSIS